MPPLPPGVSKVGLVKGYGGWNNSSLSRRSNTVRGFLSTRTPQSTGNSGGGIPNPSLGIGVISEAMPKGATGSWQPRVISLVKSFFTKVLNPNPDSGSDFSFGLSVAVSGSTIVVGDWGNSEKGARAGAVFISTDGGATFTEVVNPIPGTGTNQDFGFYVAVSGSTIVVGAPGDNGNTGAVFISTDNGANFTKKVNPAPGTGTNQGFGISVAVDGSTIVVGASRDNAAGPQAGAVFISTDNGATFTKKVNPAPGTGTNQGFGISVAVDGSTIVVGAWKDNTAATEAGAVFISTDNGGTFTKTVNPSPGLGTNQSFGYAVAVSGSTIVVGAYGDNEAGTGAGAVFISTDSGATFTKTINPDLGPGTGQNFGYSVDVSGSTIVVGAYSDNQAGTFAGAVFISTDGGATFTKRVNPNPGPGTRQNFGYAVAVSGSTIVVSVPGDNTAGPDAGAVFIHT